MKYFKILILALVAVFAVGTADAQVRVVLGGHPHHYHRRHVVVVRHYHHRWHRHY